VRAEPGETQYRDVSGSPSLTDCRIRDGDD